MTTCPQQSTAAAEELAELDDGNEDIAPVPQVALQAFCETAETAAAVQAAARDRRMSGARVRVRMGGIASAIEAYRNSPTPDVLLLETGMRGEDFLIRLDELAQVCGAATRVILIGHHNDIAIHRETMRRGVSDHVFVPLGPLDIVRAVSRLFGGPSSERLALGRVIAVIGAKGGVGASTVAHNVAWTAARDLAIETVVADLDLAFGTASLGYDQEPAWDIADAVSSPDRVDAAFIDRLMTQCADRLRLLAAPAAVDRVYDLAAESFHPVIGALRASAPCVVLDLPHVWTAWSSRILVDADDVLLVAAPDLASLRNAKNLIDMLRAARPNSRRPRYCLNQTGVPNRPEIKSSDFARALEDEPVAVIPFEPRLFGAAANSGQMIAKIEAGDPVVGLFRQLAQTLAGDAAGERGQATPLSPPSGAETVVFGKRTTPFVGTGETARLGSAAQSGRVIAFADNPAYGATKRALACELLGAIDPAQFAGLDAESKREEIRDLVSDIIANKNMVMTIAEQEDLLDDICNDVFGTGSLEALLARDEVATVMVDGCGAVYVGLAGEFAETDIRCHNYQRLLDLVMREAQRRGGALRINHVTDIAGFDGNAVITQDLFVFNLAGEGTSGASVGCGYSRGIASRPWERSGAFSDDKCLAAAIDAALMKDR